MKNYNISKTEILEELFSKNRLGIKPGLERTIELSTFAGNPHLNFKSVHIAGTNGKGSVSSSIASIFMESGYKTGLYTSPHLVDFNERIRINSDLIPDDKLIEYYLLLKNKADEIGATFFEITTVMAFMYFAECKVDIAVIETGMGGRYDSTNIISPYLSIITKIDLDHMEFLGDTIKKIAWEKAGIIKPNIPCVVSKNSDEVYEVLKLESNNNMLFADEEIDLEFVEINQDLLSKWEIVNSYIGINDFEYPIPGKYQKDNLKSILAAIHILSGIFDIKKPTIKNGMKNIINNCGLKARIELIDKNRNIILDGSHNTGSIDNLFSTLNLVYPEKKWNIIFSIMGDKDGTVAFENIKKYGKSLTIPQLKTSRASSNLKIQEIAINHGIENIKITGNVAEALEYLKNEKDILIFGSFFLAGEVLELNIFK